MPVPHRLRAFWSDTRAAVAMETAIITPVLAWVLMSSFVFFDAFRTYTTSAKATYAVADLLTRQTDTLEAFDLDGLSNLFAHMVRDDVGPRMRVTQVRFDGTDYHVDWSYGTNGQARLFDSGLGAFTDRLPIMATADRLLIVETFVPYQPAFDMGLELLTFTNFTISRPRYAAQVPPGTSITNPPGS